MAFSEQTLEEIRRRTDLIEVAGEYTVLKKTGQNFSGLCPLHSERSGSFFVHPDRQIFRCFGCNKGGNVFKFIQEVEGLSFPETVRMLAKRVGVEIVEDDRRNPKVEAPKGPKRILDALQWAAKYYHYLLNESDSYAHVKDYLKKRGISQKTIDKFQIGASPREWTNLKSQLMRRGFTHDELLEAGLIVPKENSPTDGYDRFRGRLMFPITNREGEVIGFGARILEEVKDQPKYINSSESAFFSKRKQLYGLFENQRAIRLKGEVIIVEGYMDVVGLFERGVNNAVATMGTALTPDHCEIIRSITPRVVTVFDPDTAGEEASKRSVHLFLENRIFAKDLSLPKGQDPDEFVAEHSAEQFYKLCETAPRQVTKYLRNIAAAGPVSEEQASKHLKDLLPILHSSRNNPDRATLWDDISLVLNIKIPVLQAMVDAANRNMAESKSVTAPRQVKKTAVLTMPKLHPMDMEFFRASVRFPKQFLSWPKEAWEGTLKDKVVEQWLLALRESPTIEVFEERLTAFSHNQDHPELAALAAGGLFLANTDKADVGVEFNSVAERLRNKKKELEIRALSAQVKLTQRMGDMDEQLKLLERLRQLRTT